MSSQPEDRSPSTGGPVGGAGFSSRDKLIWLGGAVLLLASLVFGFAVFGGAGKGADRGELASADGVLVEVEEDRLRLRLSEGREVLDFVVRPSDRAELDIPHLRSHARLSLPTRIYYERDGEYVARQAVDLPALP